MLKFHRIQTINSGYWTRTSGGKKFFRKTTTYKRVYLVLSGDANVWRKKLNAEKDHPIEINGYAYCRLLVGVRPEYVERLKSMSCGRVRRKGE